MDSKTSKPKRPTPVETETIVVPRIPLDIIDEILDHLTTDPNFESLKSCALVSKSWVQSCRQRLFRTVTFISKNMDGWLKTFPVPEESPAHHVRDLSVWIEWDGHVADKCFGYTPWFTAVESLWLLGNGGLPSSRGPSFWMLPQSVTSLAININAVTLVQVRDIITQLPSLDDLSLLLSLPLAPVDSRELLGLGSALKGRFGGRLTLWGGFVDKDVINMLLETPSGLHFTEVRIYAKTRKSLPLATSLAGACCKTLVKLSYKVTSHCSWYASERSFDFTKFPNLQEVTFGRQFVWGCGGLSWIPTALSTLRPVTSPRLSALRLDFSNSHLADRSIETLIQGTGDDLRQVADEVARIEREFEGAVSLTVVSDPVFKVVFDTLGILQHYSD